MNHKKAIPAKGSRSRARPMGFALWESHVPGSPGLSGTESRISTTLTMNRIEKRIPAIAPARGALSPALMASLSFSIIPPCAEHSLQRLTSRFGTHELPWAESAEKDALHHP